MQSGQVSIWVPIVVGILGVIGVVLGQLVNSWREGKRWQKELAREDLRWTREREREEARWIHERERDAAQARYALDVARREAAIRAVARYVGCLRRWHSEIWRIYGETPRGQQPTMEDLKNFHTIEQEAAEALGLLELVGNGDLQEAARDSWYEHASADSYLRGKGDGFNALSSLDDELHWVLITAKKELGFDEYRVPGAVQEGGEEPASEVSPAPPSATTS